MRGFAHWAKLMSTFLIDSDSESEMIPTKRPRPHTTMSEQSEDSLALAGKAAIRKRTKAIASATKISTHAAAEQVAQEAERVCDTSEAGHAAYTRGQPKVWRDQPVGAAAGMTMHESQSLTFEMQAGRSLEMSGFLAGILNEAGCRTSTDSVRRALQSVQPAMSGLKQTK